MNASVPMCSPLSPVPLVRRLTTRYFLVLSFVAALVIFDQAAVQPQLVQLGSFAPAINLAGRQRMLSQRLAKSALAVQAATNAESRQQRLLELTATKQQWVAAHEQLRSSLLAAVGDATSRELADLWKQIEPDFRAMCDASDRLAAQSAAAAGPDRESSAAAVEQVVAHEPQFLAGMERIVAVLEQASTRRVEQLRLQGLSIAAAIVLLLVAVGYLVVRPATGTIRQQVDSLESRVAERTAALAEANRTLASEIAHRQQAEADTQRLAAQLAHAGRVSALGQLAAGLAHEINQPLGSIANYAEACQVLIERQTDRESAIAAMFEQIKQAALRAGEIVRRIRNFARPAGGTVAPAQLHTLVREVAELCRPEIERAGVDLQLLLQAPSDAVNVDAIQIQQVLVNLLQNALQAMRTRPTDRQQVLIRTLAVDAGVQVDVCDTGPGFVDVDPDAVFSPFITTKASGLGIGLAICLSIIERHRGTIWAESPPQGGARLSFTLPVIAATHERTYQPADCLCRG